MSYDIWMSIDTGGEERASVCEGINHTSNTSGMWAKALGFSISDLEKKLGSDAIPHLERAIEYMKDPANDDELDAMAPSNGWGTVSSATRYLEVLLEMCKAHPKATIEMWY